MIESFGLPLITPLTSVFLDNTFYLIIMFRFIILFLSSLGRLNKFWLTIREVLLIFEFISFKNDEV